MRRMLLLLKISKKDVVVDEAAVDVVRHAGDVVARMYLTTRYHAAARVDHLACDRSGRGSKMSCKV